MENIQSISELEKIRLNYHIVNKYGCEYLIFLRVCEGFEDDEDTVKYMENYITNHNNLNIFDSNHMSPLILLCGTSKSSENLTRLIELMIDNGANINSCPKWSGTPLMNAIKNLNEDVVKLLLRKGCDLNKKDEDGRTAFMMLLKNDPFLRDEEMKRFISIMKMLIEDERCDVNLSDKYGNNALIIILDNFVIENRCIDNNLIRIQKISTETESYQWNFKRLELLVKSEKLDLNYMYEDPQNYKLKQTVLMYLCSSVHPPSVLELFLQQKGRYDLTMKDSKGRTILQRTCDNIHAYKIRQISKLHGGHIVDEFAEKVKLLLRYDCLVDQSIKYPNYQDVINAYFPRIRNKIGTLLLSIKNEKKHQNFEKRKIDDIEENPLSILPKELIHLILSYAYPLASQTKYCKK